MLASGYPKHRDNPAMLRSLSLAAALLVAPALKAEEHSPTPIQPDATGCQQVSGYWSTVLVPQPPAVQRVWIQPRIEQRGYEFRPFRALFQHSWQPRYVWVYDMTPASQMPAQ